MLGDLGKLIVAKGFKKLPKVQKIARSVHTEAIPLASNLRVRNIPSFKSKYIDKFWPSSNYHHAEKS